MAWICEITVRGDAREGGRVSDWLSRVTPEISSSLPGLLALDAYFPDGAEARDPYNHREDPPLLILIADFDSETMLAKGIKGAALAAALDKMPAGTEVTVTPMRREFYPLREGNGGTLNAPVSYVVRYMRPAEDEALFTRIYVETHPATQAELPEIRSIMCYFPLRDLTADRWPAADYLIGNEVVFDSVDAFNAAMQSPAREELRAHYREFPPFSGVNSHYLMQRRRLYEQ